MLNRQTKVWLALVIVLSLLALGSACGKKAEEGTSTATDTSAKKWAPKGD
jgi:hypothetical protein